MSEMFPKLEDSHAEFIANQHLFFVGTAAEAGRVNVSPKGMDTLRVIDNKTLLWLNLTGSGNETAAHLMVNNRMTVMFCSFDRQPLILRVYGKADTINPDHPDWDTCATQFPPQVGTRQFFRLHIDSVQTSCGYAVPFYEMTGQRPTLQKWADNQGRDGVEAYWQQKNTTSIDGLPTGIAESE